MLLPDLCDIRSVFLVVLIAELLAVIAALASFAPDQPFWPDLGMKSLFAQWLALGCAAVLCPFFRHVPRHYSDRRVLCLAWLLTLLVTAALTEGAWRLVVSPGDNLSHTGFFFSSMGIAALTSACLLRYLYVISRWRQSLAEQGSLRFRSLQARMRPHFLFNCLNTIAALIRERPADAEQMVEDLSTLTRASLDEQTNLAPLREELDLCRQYLRIETLRLGTRLRVEWSLDDAAQDLHMPRLTLQPLLENAIYHGIEKLPEGGVIRIRAQRMPDGILFSLENPKPTAGHAPQGQAPEGTGMHMAMRNVRQRLHMSFGERTRFTSLDSGDRYQVSFFVPRPQDKRA